MLAVWRRHVKAQLLGLLIGVLLYAGWSPFDLSRANGVRWSPTGGGLEFDGAGIVFGERPLAFPPDQGEVTLETWITPAREAPTREGIILALMDEAEVVPVALSSRRDLLSLRYRIQEPGGVGTRALSLPSALEPSRTQHLAVTSGTAGTRVYVDGVSPDRLRARNALVDAERGLGGVLVMGNSPQGSSGWIGEILAVAVYARSLTEAEVASHSKLSEAGAIRQLASEDALLGLFVFDSRPGMPIYGRLPNLALGSVQVQAADASGGADLGVRSGALRIPERFEALRWDVLSFPPPVSPLRSPRFRRDILLNLLGFVPLGALLMLQLQQVFLARGFTLRRQVALCVGIGALLSLGIELGQALLPTRFSSVLDLFLNAIGTAIGAGGVALLRHARAQETRAVAVSSAQPRDS